MRPKQPHPGMAHTCMGDNSGKLRFRVPCSAFRQLLQQWLLFLWSFATYIPAKGPPGSQNLMNFLSLGKFSLLPRRNLSIQRKHLLKPPILIALLWHNLPITPCTGALYFFTPWTQAHYMTVLTNKIQKSFLWFGSFHCLPLGSQLSWRNASTLGPLNREMLRQPGEALRNKLTCRTE